MRNREGNGPSQARVEVFARALARGTSQSDALREALPHCRRWKAETVHQEASRWAADCNVRARLAEIQAEGAKVAVLEAASVLEEVRRVALSDIAGIMHADGRVKLPHELDQATRAAVASFEIDEFGRIKYKFWDKNAALEKAAKVLGLYELDNKQKTDPIKELLGALSGNVIGARPGAAAPGEDDGA